MDTQQTFELTFWKDGIEYYFNHICACGCDENIKVYPHHKYTGVPKYVCSHNRKGKICKEVYEEREEAYKQALLNPPFCKCGCGNKIKVKPLHKYAGIPKFIHGRSSEEVRRKISETEKGKTISEKTREKLREANTGRKLSKEGIENKIKTQTGKKHSKKHVMPEGWGERFRGEKSGRWKGGIGNEPYPFEFNEKLKESVRERDGYVCQLCDKTQKENGQRLSVHHIDYNKKNCDPDTNLLSLCHSCNAKVNSKREYWTEFFQQKMTQRIKNAA